MKNITFSDLYKRGYDYFIDTQESGSIVLNQHIYID